MATPSDDNSSNANKALACGACVPGFKPTYVNENGNLEMVQLCTEITNCDLTDPDA